MRHRLLQAQEASLGVQSLRDGLLRARQAEGPMPRLWDGLVPGAPAGMEAYVPNLQAMSARQCEKISLQDLQVREAPACRAGDDSPAAGSGSEQHGGSSAACSGGRCSQQQPEAGSGASVSFCS